MYTDTMNRNAIQRQIFKKGSKTYFTSSLFFPPAKRDDVFKLYAFVRTADDFVDELPQNADGFYAFKTAYRNVMRGTASGNPVIDSFVEISKKYAFDPVWAEAFLYSMELDLTKKQYDSIEECLEYIYGSAEVIGLFMAAVMELPQQAHRYAKLLGRAMQYINFIRDIDEDTKLGRRYLPLDDSGLENLDKAYCMEHQEAFTAFHRSQIRLYTDWHTEAVKGYFYIPRRLRIPVKTAEDMYMWTAEQIEKDPLIVFRKKVKPSRFRIILQILINLVIA